MTMNDDAIDSLYPLLPASRTWVKFVAHLAGDYNSTTVVQTLLHRLVQRDCVQKNGVV